MSWRRLRDDESGQALLWGAGTLVLIVALFYGTLDLGRSVLGKIQAQNAADAAALASAGVKASVHNTRSVAYRAITGQVELSRKQYMGASAAALALLAGGKPAAFDSALARAQWQAGKVSRLREGLQGFNAWIAAEGAKGAGQLPYNAALGAYLSNLGDAAAGRGPGDTSNPAFMPEYEKTMGANPIGGFPYSGEVLGASGFAGHSLVRGTPSFALLGARGNRVSLPAMGVAGPVHAGPAYQATGGSVLERTYGIQWYTVRLEPIGENGLTPDSP